MFILWLKKKAGTRPLASVSINETKPLLNSRISAFFIFLLIVLISGISAQTIRISPNGRFFAQTGGRPFFWLGDTGWLLFKKCSREETVAYLETRQKQGFNLIQVMVLHDR